MPSDVRLALGILGYVLHADVHESHHHHHWPLLRPKEAVSLSCSWRLQLSGLRTLEFVMCLCL